jgi:hypothetical protein
VLAQTCHLGGVQIFGAHFLPVLCYTIQHFRLVRKQRVFTPSTLPPITISNGALTMPMPNPQQAAEKWSRNLGSASQTIQEGVQAVSVSPTQKAAERVNAYVQGVQRAVADGKFQAGLRRVSLEDWKRSMIQKGVPRIASGASAAIPKFADFMSEFLPHVEAGLRQLESMPRGDLPTNIQRAVAMMEHNSRFRRRG